MQHLTRPVLLLLTVFLLLGAARWAIPRMFNQISFAIQDRTVPVGTLLGAGGHANVPQDIEAWKARQVQYAGPASCTQCHQESVAQWKVGDHAGVSCETCHGVASDHTANETPLPTETSSALCTLCHSTTLGRPSSFSQVKVHQHAGEATCASCHNPHNPGVQGLPTDLIRPKPSAPLVQHVVVAEANCTMCHGQGRLRPYPQDHAGWQSPGCLLCHETGPTPTLVGASATLGAPFAGLVQAPSVPHVTDGVPSCTRCHDSGAVRPFPQDHIGWSAGVCLLCHQAGPAPAVGGTAVGSPAAGGGGDAPRGVSISTISADGLPPLPHTVVGYTQCQDCHGSDQFRPFPSDHQGWEITECLLCHKSK